MYIFSRSMSVVILSLFIIFSAFSAPLETDGEQAATIEDVFRALEKCLVEDGVDPCLLECVFRNGILDFDHRGVGLYFVHNESVFDYDSFSNPASIFLAKKYMKKHNVHLEKVEHELGVDKTVITAIILVESGLGTFVGKRPVVKTLASMAIMSDPVARELVWNTLDEERRLSREDFLKKSEVKSQWAYNELTAFLRYVDYEKLDPFSLKGSYAGAIGIPQFLPSSILSLAEDGNADGVVDMFDHADAILSVANYLSQHGWNNEIDEQKAREVLYTYNRSKPYVSALIKISKLLKGDNG